MVGDHYTQKFQGGYNAAITVTGSYGVAQWEFEALKKEVLEMKELLLRAKKYDEKNNDPNCEQEQKVELLKKIADIVDIVGVSLDEVFGKK